MAFHVPHFSFSRSLWQSITALCRRRLEAFKEGLWDAGKRILRVFLLSMFKCYIGVSFAGRVAAALCKNSSNAAKAVAYQSGALDVLRPRSQGPGRDLTCGGCVTC